MDETVEKIELFKKREKLGKRIAEIIEERDLQKDSDIKSLKEYKEFIIITDELKSKFN